MIKLLLLFLSYFILIKGQEIGWSTMEIFMATEGLVGNQRVRYKLESIGTIYEGYIVLTRTFEIYQGNTFRVAYYPPLDSNGAWNTNFYSMSDWNGFDLRYQGNISLYFDQYIHGVYKLYMIDEQGNYIFIDFRDTRYPDYPYPVYGHGTDIWIKYNAIQKKFFYTSIAPNIQNPSNTNWIPINNKSLITIWQIKGQQNFGSPKTIEFPNFWQNSLVLVETEDNHPMLILGSYPIQNIYNSLEYFIYRKVGNNSSFVKIATLPSTTLSYIDESIYISHILGGTPVYY